jgi:hypothetical protein
MSDAAKLILPIGTQIVVLKDIKVLNEDRFQPRGTVGVIKSAPQDATHSYVAEFLDGSVSAGKTTRICNPQTLSN